MQTNTDNGGPAILDAAWERINALGGYSDPADLEGRGYGRALDEVLAIIEALGGRDPVTRPREIAA